MKIDIHNKGFTLRLALKLRLKRTRKWLIWTEFVLTVPDLESRIKGLHSQVSALVQLQLRIDVVQSTGDTGVISRIIEGA